MTTITKTCQCGCGEPVATNGKLGGQKWALGHAPNSVKRKVMPLAYPPMPERPDKCWKCESTSIYLDTMEDSQSSSALLGACWRCFTCGGTYFLSPGTTLEGKYITTRAPRPRRR